MITLSYHFRKGTTPASIGLLLPPGSPEAKQKPRLVMVCVSSREAKIDVPSLTDYEEEIIVLAAGPNLSLIVGTRPGQSYLKKYDEVVASPSKPTQEPTKQCTKQPVEK